MGSCHMSTVQLLAVSHPGSEDGSHAGVSASTMQEMLACQSLIRSINGTVSVCTDLAERQKLAVICVSDYRREKN